MAVPIESIQVGRVFEFKGGPRRVVNLSPPLGSGFQVKWEYADGVKRNGKLGGSQWVHYFRKDAKRELIADPDSSEVRKLLTSQTVPSQQDAVPITLTTKCPRKWRMVDLESGEVWTHDGEHFTRAEPADVREMAQALLAKHAGLPT